MKNELFYLSILMFLTFSLPSQNLTWEKVNGPYGGIGKVSTGKDGYLILETSNNIIYRSNNGGVSWERMPATPANIWHWPLEVGADHNLYAGQSQSLFRSTDNGESWTLLNNQISYETVFALPGGEILLGTTEGIKRSSDNGQSWQLVSGGTDAGGGFAYNPFNGDVYTWSGYTPSGELSTLLRSSDQGLTWSVALQVPELNGDQMAFSPNGTIFLGARNYIWRSFDNGTTWTNLDAFFQDSYREVMIAVTNTGRLFAHEWYISKYSDDNGDTWHPLVDDYDNNFDNFSSDGAGKIFARRGDGSLYFTENNGASWNFAAGNILRASIKSLTHLSNDRLLAHTYDGIFYSPDNGSSWNLIWDGVISSSYESFSDGALVAGNAHWYYWDGINKVVRFTDEGQTQQVLNIPGLSNTTPLFGLWVGAAPQTVFAHTSSGFYRSADGGENWTPLAIQFYLQSVIAIPDGNLLANGSDGLYRSGDDGQNWVKISEINFWNADPIHVGGNGQLYAQYHPSDLFVSPDGGLTWDSTRIQYQYTLSDISVNNFGHLFMYDYSNNEVVRSVDGGLSFHPAGGLSAISGGAYYGRYLSINSAQHLYLNQNGNGIYRSVHPTTDVKIVTGNAWHDLDENCNYAQPDTLLQRHLVKLTKDGQTVYGYANDMGRYFAPVTPGEYEVAVVAPSDYWLSCNETATVPDNDLIGLVDSVDAGIRVGIECPLASVSVSAPFLRRCFESLLYVRYENRGTLPAEGAYLTITLDPDLAFNGASFPVAAQNGDTYTFQLGDLAVGASGEIILTVTPSCDLPLGAVHCVEAHIYPDEFCIEPIAPQIVTSAHCVGGNIELQINNIGNAGMSTPLSWFVVNPGSPAGSTIGALALGTFQLDAGATFTTTIAAANTPLDFYAEQAPEYPFNTFSQTTIQGCGAGQTLSSSNNDDMGPFTDLLCQPAIGAFDPNDKQGMPAGLTENGYIEHDQSLTYLIRFQNTGTDTAFNVNVRDTLPEALDPATVTLLNASHPCDLRIMANGSLMFVFDHIMLPDSNVNESASHGFVQFAVRQKPNNPTGALIRNKAGIYFDFNEPVITNQTLHTVGIPEVVITGTEQPLPGEMRVQAMPNPFTESFTVNLSSAISDQTFHLSLIDSNGRIVAKKTFSVHSVNIPRNNLPEGVYHFLIVNANGKRIGNGTVVAQ